MLPGSSYVATGSAPLVAPLVAPLGVVLVSPPLVCIAAESWRFCSWSNFVCRLDRYNVATPNRQHITISAAALTIITVDNTMESEDPVAALSSSSDTVLLTESPPFPLSDGDGVVSVDSDSVDEVVSTLSIVGCAVIDNVVDNGDTVGCSDGDGTGLNVVGTIEGEAVGSPLGTVVGAGVVVVVVVGHVNDPKI